MALSESGGQVESVLRELLPRKGYKLLTHEGLSLLYDEDSTGIRSMNMSNRMSSSNKIGLFRQYFSKRNVNNPIFFISFVLLAAPLRYKPQCIIKIIVSPFKRLF